MDDSLKDNLLSNNPRADYLETPTEGQEGVNEIAGGASEAGRVRTKAEKINAQSSATIELPTIDPEDALRKLANGEVMNEQKSDLTPERKQQLEEEIANTAEFFNKFGGRWYMSGGTGLELASGGLTRDHDDVDVAMFPEDLTHFYEYATTAGYDFVRPLKPDELAQYKAAYGRDPEITREDPNKRTWVKVKDGNELATGHNAFAKPVLETASLANGFEVITLQKDPATNGVVFGADKDIIFPAETYKNAPAYTAINGQEVPLTPITVQLMYKLYEGRQKDFEDIQRTVPTLDGAERKALETLLDTAKVAFKMSDGTTTSTLDTLMQNASQEATQHLADITMSFDQRLDPVYSTAIEASTKDEFYKKLEQMFGSDLVAKRSVQIAATADFMFADTKPTRDQFNTFARENAYHADYLQHRKQTFSPMQRWIILKTSDNTADV